MKKLVCAASLALLIADAHGAMAQDSAVHLGGAFGFDYSDGNYGTAINTDVLMELPTLSAKVDNFQFDASMPYMRISGRGLVVFDASGNPVVINRHTSLPPDVRTGFGDLNLSATYAIPPAVMDDFDIKLTARAKLPVASERRRLSTGEADFGASVDVSHQYGKWDPFVTVGYLVPGQPKTYSLNNTLSVSTGASYEVANNLVAIASYDYDSASSPLVSSSQEVFGSLSWIATDEITLTAYATRGLSDGSPSTGTGLILTYGFD